MESRFRFLLPSETGIILVDPITGYGTMRYSGREIGRMIKLNGHANTIGSPLKNTLKHQ